jgi:hypothetical protein
VVLEKSTCHYTRFSEDTSGQAGGVDIAGAVCVEGSIEIIGLCGGGLQLEIPFKCSILGLPGREGVGENVTGCPHTNLTLEFIVQWSEFFVFATTAIRKGLYIPSTKTAC